MAYILAIETATKICSVSLFEDDQLIAFREEDKDYSHAEKLATFVDLLIQENELSYKQLSAVAVSKGPGSYTGLRIGVSFAKGLCYSLKIPLISVETLKAMAFGISEKLKQDELLCPMIDARRMEVYSAVYNSKLNMIKKISADIVEKGSYSEYLSKKKVYFFGDGAEKCQEVIKHKNAKFLKDFVISSKNMGVMAFQSLQNEEFESVAYFEPYYLKEFIALKGKTLV